MNVNKTLSSINNVSKLNNENVTFTGKTANWVIKNTPKMFEPERSGNMSRNLFTAAAFVFLLGGRIIKSRDKNERRETLTRDIPTILIAVYGVPVFGQIVANQIQKRTGLSIASIGKDAKKDTKKNLLEKTIDRFPRLKEAINTNVASGNQLKDWYVYDPNLHSGEAIAGKSKTGFDTFLSRLSEDLHANLKRVVSYLNLGDDVKGQITKLSEDNIEFVKQLKDNLPLKQTLERAFNYEHNGALKQAEYLKALPKAAGFAITLALIGIGIPKLNIFITERINKKNKSESKSAASNKPEKAKEKRTFTSADVVKTAKNSSSEKSKTVYSSFIEK